MFLLIYFSEIGKVRGNLFQINGKKNEPLVLPDAAGPSITLSEKVYVPIKEFPDVRIFIKTVLVYLPGISILFHSVLTLSKQKHFNFSLILWVGFLVHVE